MRTAGLFADRDDAGRALGELLHRRGTVAGQERPLVLALPRGGVPVGVRVAQALGAELDVVVARKIGLPWQPELGVGAVTEDGPPVVDRALLHHVGLTEADLAEAVAAERAEVRRRTSRYRGDRPPAPVAGRPVLVTDDGLATGVSARAALRAVREAGPSRLVLAVPVAAADRAEWLVSCGAADEVVAVRRTGNLVAVGRWYHDFSQLDDDRVVALLRRAWAGEPR